MATLETNPPPMPTAKRTGRPSPAKRFAGIENISILGITELIDPLGLQLCAESYFAVAQALSTPQVPFEPVRPFLVCHAIELGLKAFLSLKGHRMVTLSQGPFGHKLSTILNEAEAAGLLDVVPLSTTHREAIKSAETYYAGAEPGSRADLRYKAAQRRLSLRWASQVRDAQWNLALAL